MNKKIILAVLIPALFMAAQLRAEFNCADPVQTKSGLLQGSDEKAAQACVWKGIPFAAPPVGDLRWKAPQPIAWSGVREADEFGHQCMQKGIFTLEVKTSKEGMSEDCLYLNVWRPKTQDSRRLPVMLWVHGGGYTGGTASTPMYFGDRLAAQGDVVVVTTNYRLNVFGFFASPALRSEDPHKSVGSYATLDQVAALQWVHDNIANFGGDPTNVTIFGESAGGFSICTLLATPLTKGLFDRAILESGGCEESENLEQGFEHGKEIAQKLGCPENDLKCLRAVPAKALLEKGSGGMMEGGSVPHEDGYVLTGTPLSMIQAGNYNHVPFLAGNNRDEFGKAIKLMKAPRQVKPAGYEQGYIEMLKVPPADAKKLVELYPLSEFDNRPVEAYGRALGADASLGCPSYQGLLEAAKQQPDTWYYRFDFDQVALGKYMGAFHSLEIPFIFDNFDRLPMNLFFKDKYLPEAQALGKIMQSYWTNFAKTGNPNSQGLPSWPAFRPDSRQVQILDSQVRTEPASFAPRCEFWYNYTRNRKLERPKSDKKK